MTSSLTKGRRPLRGYKHGMSLEDAYEELQWGTPLSLTRATGGAPSVVRGTGSSAHMLLELYLDMHASRNDQFGLPMFLVECVSQSHGAQLRSILKNISERLKLDVDLNKVQFFPQDQDTKILRGITWNSWAVFCDHAVREHKDEGSTRNSGPYGVIRSVEPCWDFATQEGETPIWKAYDRDQRFVLTLTQKGLESLQKTVTCPLTLGGEAPTTYPASYNREILKLVRLRKAFSR